MKTDPMKLIQKLSILLGIWKGDGKGKFPTIEPFDYIEELTFERHKSKPIMHFIQKTWNKSSMDYMHWESGFFIAKDDGTWEISNSQGGGRTEVLHGTMSEETDGTMVLSFSSKVIGNDEKIAKTGREFKIKGKTLHYVVTMQTHGMKDSQQHLEATLTKVA
jgi:hypothetical protein